VNTRDPLALLGATNGHGHNVTAPTIERHGDDFTLTWPEHAVVVTVTDLHKSREGIKAELAVALSGEERHWGQINLLATPAREQLVKKLTDIDGTIPWRALLERACRLVVNATKQGAPIVELMGEAPLATPDLVTPFVVDGQTCTIFADGDSGKSLLAAAIAVAMVTGRTLPGGIKARRPGPVMVCDWETDRGAWDGRVHGLCAGLGFEMPTGIYYRPMDGALTDDVTLASGVSRCGPAAHGLPPAHQSADVSEDADRARGLRARLGRALESLQGPSAPRRALALHRLAQDVRDGLSAAPPEAARLAARPGEGRLPLAVRRADSLEHLVMT
jgi:hypothetical protein